MLITDADLTTYLGTGASAYSPAQITAIVLWADAAVKKYCERDIEATDYRQWLRCNSGRLLLPQYPIIELYRATGQAEDVATLTNSATDAGNLSAALANGHLDLRVIGGAMDGTHLLTLATYTSMTLLIAAVNALTAPHGWLMVPMGGVSNAGARDPRDLKPFSSGLLSGSPIYLAAPYSASDNLTEIDYEAGIVKGGWQGWVFADYSAGYSTIPADLIGACAGIAADALRIASTGTTMQEERIGDYSYKLGSALTNDVLSILKPYAFILDSYKKRGLTTVLV